MKQSQTKKVYIYPIEDNDGTPLDLINVLTHVSLPATSTDEVGQGRTKAGGAYSTVWTPSSEGTIEVST